MQQIVSNAVTFRIWPVASLAALQRHVRSWNTSRHSADIMNVRAATFVTPRLMAARATAPAAWAMLTAMAPGRHRSPGALTCAKLGALGGEPSGAILAAPCAAPRPEFCQ